MADQGSINKDQTHTVQLLIKRPTTRHTHANNKLSKLNAALSLLIKDPKHMFRKFTRIAKGEELLVDFEEFDAVDEAVWAVADESFVPALKLFLFNFWVKGNVAN